MNVYEDINIHKKGVNLITTGEPRYVNSEGKRKIFQILGGGGVGGVRLDNR